MEHHVSSSAGGTTNAYSQARISYYGIGGIPESFFDGITSVLGGSTGTYSAFLSKYNQRIAIPSDFTISLNGMSDGLDYTVVMSIENVEPNTSSSLVAHLSLTESDVVYSGTAYHFVTRRFWPDAAGTPVAFTSKSSETVLLEFTMDASWDLDNCEFIGFIQDNSNKEILQAVKVSVNDLMPMYMDNSGAVAINMVPVTNCAGMVEPVVTIINEGASNLSAVDINYKVNNEDLNTHSWTGDLGYGETEMVTLPPIYFELQDENDLMVYTTNPNGNPDEDPVNDTTATSFVSAEQAVPDIYLFLKLDGNPEETSWELKNSNGDVLYSGDNYTEPQAFVKDTFELATNDCFTFYLYDEGGDGLTGGGYFALRESNFSVIYENYDFEAEEELVQFAAVVTSVTELEEKTNFSVFPNPFENQTHIGFTLENRQNVSIEVYNLMGERIIRIADKTYESGRHVETFHAAELNAGIYFVKVKIGENVMTEKISLR